MSHPDQQHYFLSVLRGGAGYIGWLKPGDTFAQRWFETEDDALSIIRHRHPVANIWASMATFPSEAKGRKAEGAIQLRSFWFDVDAHGKGPYATPKACGAALRRFVKTAGLPNPNFLHETGHGVQIFWTLPEPITRDEWQPVADRLQELGMRLDLGADPITIDAARILRVPGTLNLRDPLNARDTVLHQINPSFTDLHTFAAAIDTALGKLPAKPSKAPKAAVKNAIPDTPENEARLRAMLAVLAPDCEYDEWRDIIWSVAAAGLTAAEDIAREWSAQWELWDEKAEKAFSSIWSSYDPDREKAVGFGTLVHLAREAGYTGPLPGEEFAKLDFTQNAIPSPYRSGGLVTHRASDIEPEPVDWLVQDAIPLGMLAVIGGQPGMGKSQIAIKLAAAVTTGEGLPDSSGFERVGSVIVLANEDDAARTIRPRLDAAGANTGKVHIVEGVAREGRGADHFQMDTDVAALRVKAEELGDVRLIIIDPPSAYLGSKVDAHKESDVRRVLAPLSQLAHDTGALVLLVVHLNKRSDGGAQQRFGGSTAWIAAPRAAFLVAEDEATRRRFMLPVKNNLGNDRLGFEYRVTEKLIDYPRGAIKAPHIEWLGKSDRPASELLNPPKTNNACALEEAKEFLRQTLADGAKPAAEVESAAEAAGISRATLMRAKKDMQITSKREGNGWTWKLGSIFNEQVA